VADDEIVVTNGFCSYDTSDGATVVTVDEPTSVRSVNGPPFTLVVGIAPELLRPRVFMNQWLLLIVRRRNPLPTIEPQR